MAKKIKLETFTLADAINVAYSSLQELRDEIREVVDNAPEGLRESQRIQTLEETADTFDGFVDDEPTVEDAEAAALDVQVMPLPKRASRGARRDYSVSLMMEAIETIRAHIEALSGATDKTRDATADKAVQDTIDALEEIADQLDNHISDAEGCEFPGMFG